MIDLQTAAQNGIHAALNVAAVTDLAPLFQHVPDETEPPMVIIGELAAEPIGGKDSQLDRITAEVITIVREPRRAALFALMSAVRTALEGVALAAAGAELSRPVFEGADDDLAEDGQTYIGTQRFSLIAQPA